MRKSILKFLGILIMLSMIFIAGNDFLTRIKSSIDNNKKSEFYRENSMFYVSGKVFKIKPVINFSYILFVKVDSINILKTVATNDRISGIYDIDSKTAFILAMSRFRSGIENKNSAEFPYVTYRCNPEENIYGFEFQNDKFMLSDIMINSDANDEIGKILLQEADSLTNYIKF
ncbi:hypothetical protein ACI76O_11745 [Capnocytophaga cynodegmi]|uniref:hypothetical protein n=1 Tax=Capnocytophaga cynodegmi TaxID=28189 RepID=UPI00385B276A